MDSSTDNAMVFYGVKIRKDQKEQLDTLKAKGYNPAQIIRIGLDRELEIKKQEVGR